MSSDCPSTASGPRVRTAEELRAEVANLEGRLAEADKMALLGRLIASVVHEINTPIGSVFSNNQVAAKGLETLSRMLEEPAPPPKAQQIVKTLRSLSDVDRMACERISALIRSVRNFSRGDGERPARAALQDVLANSIKLAETSFRNRIAIEAQLGPAECECYPSAMGQVFLNILVNAGQAIENDGRIQVKLAVEDGWAHAAITDNGQGIRPENCGCIFKEGFTTKPMGEGTGLGLSIARRIVEEKHQGRIWFESTVGVGTTFHVSVPVAGPVVKGEA